MTTPMTPELALFVACGKSQDGSEERVRDLVAAGVKATFRQRGEGGWTTRMQCHHYRRGIVSIFVGHPCVNLCDAAIDGDLAEATRFLDEGASPDALDAYRQNWPLRYAACGGHREVVTLLLARGARVMPDDAKPWNHPLVGALAGGHLAVADALWATGARVPARAPWRMLDWILKEKAPDASLAWALAHEPDGDRAVALHTATHYGTEASLAWLLANGASVDAVRGGRTALMTAAFFRDVGKVSVLLAAGADVHARDPRGYTPMHYAICSDHSDDPDFPFAYAPRALETPVAHALVAAGAVVPPP